MPFPTEEGDDMSDVPNNPYEAPKADVNAQASDPGPSGSLEDALAGRYDFDIGQVMREAWELTRGMKASFWGAAIIVYAIMAVFALVVASVAGKSLPLRLLTNVAFGTVSPVLFIGIIMMGVRRAAGLPINFATAFSCFDRAVPVFLAGLLTTLLTYVGLILLVIPGIYLVIAYCMTMPLIADRRLPPWQAIETSRKAVTKRWFQYFGLLLVVGLLVGLSALPLGIGLIWTAPWCINVIGVVYRRTFGVAQTA
jgi:uncharacterized membrane protein